MRFKSLYLVYMKFSPFPFPLLRCFPLHFPNGYFTYPSPPHTHHHSILYIMYPLIHLLWKGVGGGRKQIVLINHGMFVLQQIATIEEPRMNIHFIEQNLKEMKTSDYYVW